MWSIIRPNQESKSFFGDIKVNLQSRCTRTQSTDAGQLPVYITGKTKIYNTTLGISFSMRQQEIMVFFNITMLAPWHYPLKYPFARAFRYWSWQGPFPSIFGRQQPQLTSIIRADVVMALVTIVTIVSMLYLVIVKGSTQQLIPIATRLALWDAQRERKKPESKHRSQLVVRLKTIKNTMGFSLLLFFQPPLLTSDLRLSNLGPSN